MLWIWTDVRVCALSQGADITYTYGGKDFLIKALAGPAEFKTCATTSTAAMNVAADCGAAVVGV